MRRSLWSTGAMCLGLLAALAVPTAATAATAAPAKTATPASSSPAASSASKQSALRLPASPTPKRPKPAAPRPSSAGGVPAGEEIVTATSDTSGYHVFAASAGDGWRWHALATLQPGGYDEEAWIGEHCTTGDGRYVVAVVAPWSANNSAAGIAAGGIAYAIDAHTGAVRPLASGLMLSYFNPGCGTGSTVALSRYTDTEQSATQILTVNAATGASSVTPVIPDQVTSAVPVAGALYAAEGSRLVTISATGAVTTVSSHLGPVFDLTPNTVGAVDYLTTDATDQHAPAAVYRVTGRPGRPGTETKLASGTLSSLRLLPGPAGADGVSGAAPGAAIATRPTSAALSADSFADISTGATMAVVPGAKQGTVLLAGTASTTRGGGTLPTAAAPTKTLPLASTPHTGTATKTATAGGKLSPAAVIPPGGDDSGATCAVPRNDPTLQVPQPTDQQIDWALNLAGQYGLPGRSDAWANLHTGAYDPSADFPLPAPFNGSELPQQIMQGIFAQESNWKQASPHAPEGLSGNPLIADYYGIYNNVLNPSGYIDYPDADCGYGLGQITDIMRLGAESTSPTALQKRVAVDYTENAAATAYELASKWVQLSDAGITVGNNDPMELEDWYFAIWAYNSGVNPQAVTGNTTGCTPGPSCTDSAGNWGLGWTNNPANPTYDPLRHPFLHYQDPTTLLQIETYNDAASPQDWPYQEKVYGWMESGQLEGDGSLKFTPMYDYSSQSGSLIYLPSVYNFCDSSDNCNPFSLVNPCGYNANTGPLQWHCWWHEHVGDPCPLIGGCNRGSWDYTVNDAEPVATNPFPSICSPPSDFTDTYIVDDEVAETNLAGCSGMADANAAMTWSPNLDPNDEPFGDIDLHQLGTGYGGRTMFTHLEDTSNSLWGGTMTWQPNNLPYDVYDIEVFIPSLAAAGNLTYTVHSGQPLAPSALSIDGTVQPDLPAGVTVNQNDYGNQWVSLGTFYLSPGSYVTATNVVAGGDGTTDVAFDAMAFRPVSSYVSLGDSYSSGEGTTSYDPETSVSGGDMCHRSSYSYARVWATSHGTPGVPTVQLACSGAVMSNLTTTGQYGEPAQIPATPRHASDVFLTIGGNDAGFAEVLKTCIISALSRTACEDYYSQADANNLSDLIDSLQAPLASTYQDVLATAPSANIIPITYPSIFMPGANDNSCLNIGYISDSDVAWLITVAQHLDDVIDTAASQAGLSALDERYAFVGHELCTSSSPWVNGLLDSLQNLDLSMSFHPNANGYQQISTDLNAFQTSAAVQRPAATEAAAAAWTWRHPNLGIPSLATAKNMLIDTSDPAALVNAQAPRTDNNYTARGGEALFNIWGQDHTCSVADIIRARDGDNVVRAGTNNCLVDSGMWQSPYDLLANQNVVAANRNQVIGNYTVTPPVPQVIQIDHVVNLHDAWDMGANSWSTRQRNDFGNDLVGPELVTVSASINNTKSDQTIDTWTPPNPDFVCTFAKMYTSIKYLSRLELTPAEYNALYNILFTDC